MLKLVYLNEGKVSKNYVKIVHINQFLFFYAFAYHLWKSKTSTTKISTTGRRPCLEEGFMDISVPDRLLSVLGTPKPSVFSCPGQLNR